MFLFSHTANCLLTSPWKGLCILIQFFSQFFSHVHSLYMHSDTKISKKLLNIKLINKKTFNHFKSKPISIGKLFCDNMNHFVAPRRSTIWIDHAKRHSETSVWIKCYVAVKIYNKVDFILDSWHENDREGPCSRRMVPNTSNCLLIKWHKWLFWTNTFHSDGCYNPKT